MKRLLSHFAGRFRRTEPKPAAGDPTAYLNEGSHLLRNLGRPDAAEKVLAAAAENFPQNLAIAVEFALCAQVRGDLEAVARRYHRAQQLEPDNPNWIIARTTALRDLRRFDEADAILKTSMSRLAPNASLLGAYASIAQNRGDHVEALRRWESLRSNFPDDATSWLAIGQLLVQNLGQPEQAENHLQTAIERFPDDVGIAMEHAKAAAALRNWDESLRRWTTLALRFPDNARVSAGRGDAELKLQLRAIDTADQPEPAGVAISKTSSIMALGETGPGSEHRALMMGFESLGANCEFGLVQRHFGAEPLGLLRWNSIQPEQLINALEQRFEGIGELENVQVTAPNGVYDVQDLRYGSVMHSFLSQHDTALAPEQLRLQFARRMRFLRDKLVQDLTAGEKIFVYQYKRLLTAAETARLQAALQAYGSNTLLFVHDIASNHPTGHVEQTHPGLLTGYVDRLVRDAAWSSISVDAWLTVCQNAANLHRSRR